nr:TasA family protein [Haloarcula salina]
MSDKNIAVTRRRVLGGIVTVGAASAAVGAGTFAFFSDTETSTDNTVQAGTVDLNQASVTGSSSLGDNLAPGDSFTLQIETTYDGSIDGVDLNLDARLQEPSTDPDSGGEDNPSNTDLSAAQFASALSVDTAYVQINPGSSGPQDDLLSADSPGGDINTDIDLSSATVDDGGQYEVSGVDLDDVIADGLSGQNDYATLQGGDTVRVHIAGTLDENLGNAGQEDGVDIEVAFGVQQSDATNQGPTF